VDSQAVATRNAAREFTQGEILPARKDIEWRPAGAPLGKCDRHFFLSFISHRTGHASLAVRMIVAPHPAGSALKKSALCQRKLPRASCTARRAAR
jgi:hypothetical protein